MNRFFRWLQFSTMAIQLVEMFGRQLTGAQKALKAAQVTEEFMQMGQSIDQETLVNTLNKHDLLGNKKTAEEHEHANSVEAEVQLATAESEEKDAQISSLEAEKEAEELRLAGEAAAAEEAAEEAAEISDKDAKIAVLEAELEALRNPGDNG